MRNKTRSAAEGFYIAHKTRPARSDKKVHVLYQIKNHCYGREFLCVFPLSNFSLS